MILCGTQGDSVRMDYNVPFTNSFNVDEIMTKLQQITAETTVCYKVLFSVGKIMFNTSKRTFRYWVPFENDSLLSKSLFVTKPADLVNVRQALLGVDAGSYLMANRPNTKNVCVFATNIVITIFETFYPMGRASVELPNYLIKHKSLLTLQNYSDNLCFFRCLSQFKFGSVREGYVRFLYRRWMEYCVENKMLMDSVYWGDFEGVTLQDLPLLEELFKTNVQVYSLNEDKSVNLIYRSALLYKKTMYLNEYEGHLSYIVKFSQYAKRFVCGDCDYVSSRHDSFKNHLRNCSTVRKVKVHSGYYESKLSLFEKMSELGIYVPEKLRYIHDFSIYDFESLLLSKSEEISSATQIVQVHKPLSFSIVSTLDGFTEPIFVVDKDEGKLIDEFHKILCSMQEKYSSKMKEIYAPYLDLIQEKIDYWKPPKIVHNNREGGISCDDISQSTEDQDVGSECGETDECEPPSKEFLQALSRPNPWNSFINNLVENDRWEIEYNKENEQGGEEQNFDEQNSSDIQGHSYFEENQFASSEDMDSNQSFPECDIGEDGEEITNGEQLRVPRNLIRFQKIMYKKFVSLHEELTNFINRLSLISFNSSKYDLKIIQSNLWDKFDPVTLKVIKKNNRLISVTTPHFRFLDILVFLSPGTNYASFVRAFATDSNNLEENKLYFPYGALCSFDNLMEKSLPPLGHDHWYSKLRNKSVLDDAESGRTEKENYELMQKVWVDNSCSNLLDFLKLYNNQDVIPFKSSVETLLARYRQSGLCLLSRCISGPSLSRLLMFKYASEDGCYFALPGKRNASLQKLLLSGIIGGNSCVYRRHVKVGHTSVWGHDPNNLTRSIKGYDASSLYGGCLAGDMPCGPFVRRFREDGFKIGARHDIYTLQYQYIEWYAKKVGRKPLHRQSRGRETYIGVFKPDAILLPSNSSQKSLILEFLGCYSHFHFCNKTRHCSKNKEWMENVHKKSNEWELKQSYYEQLNYDCHFVRECWLDELYDTDEDYRNLVDSKRPNFARKFPGSLSEQQIIDGLVKDQLYGIVVTDIELPDDWSPELKDKLHCPQELTPAQFFDVYPPVMGSVDIKYPDHWSPIMKKYAEEMGIATNNRKLLVAGIKAEQLPISSGYAKFLLTHGFILKNISQIVEYFPKKAFRRFVNERTNWRRQADECPRMGILATQGKSENNYAFGSTLTDSSKWTDVNYVKGVRAASKEVNNKLFIKLEAINVEKQIFEVEKQKKVIEYRHPTQIGFFILWESKKHVLSFYYDYVLRLIDYHKVSVILSDTDSIYLNLAQYTFEGCVKEEMKSFFHYLTKGRCAKVTNITYIEPDQDTYFQRSCCGECHKKDKRTPLLFHLEGEGQEIIALCSKTYCLIDKIEPNSEELSIVKFSCKGQNRSNVKLDGSQYKIAYNSQIPVSADNMGFRYQVQKGQDSQMVTYQTTKLSFSFLFLKRFVHNCSCCTSTLNVVIRPKKITL